MPRDVECEGFELTYARIASDKSPQSGSSSSLPSTENDVDKKVDDAIESFLRSLSQIGPELMSVSSCGGAGPASSVSACSTTSFQSILTTAHYSFYCRDA